jgi:hypothetical protein
MTKHRTSKRRSQKGGDWYNPFSWGQSSDPNAPKKSVLDSITGATSSAVSGINSGLGSVATGITSGSKSAWDSTKNMMSSNVDLMGSTPTATATPAVAPVTPTVAPMGTQPTTGATMGGRRRRRGRGRTMKGGKDGLGLTYYASPVSGLKVAEPTTWQHYANGTNQYSTKGGSKSRRRKSSRKSRKSRRHRKH